MIFFIYFGRKTKEKKLKNIIDKLSGVWYAEFLGAFPCLWSTETRRPALYAPFPMLLLRVEHTKLRRWLLEVADKLAFRLKKIRYARAYLRKN